MANISMNGTITLSYLPSDKWIERPSLFSFMPDQHLPYVLPAILYWVLGLSFYFVDLRGYFSSYKVHTPSESAKKNRATLAQVVRFALIQQVAQIILGYIFSDGIEHVHTDNYGVALWARRSQSAAGFIPSLIDVFGVDSGRLGICIGGSIGGLIANGTMNDWALGHDLSQSSSTYKEQLATFSHLDIILGQTFHWVLVPAFQFLVALFCADSVQYFCHMLLHKNKWLYKHVHYLHHEVVVNFAFGAQYNHPLETIPIDGVGLPICMRIAQLSTRQATFFSMVWTTKNVMDHSGYDFWWDPCNLLCPKSQWYHDLHHQTWGTKYNFSNWTPFWDYLLGTMWNPLDTKAQDRYARAKEQVVRQVEKGNLRAKTEHELAVIIPAVDHRH